MSSKDTIHFTGNRFSCCCLPTTCGTHVKEVHDNFSGVSLNDLLELKGHCVVLEVCSF